MEGLRLLQEQDLNTGKHQTYCYEEHGSYTPLAVIVKQSSGFIITGTTAILTAPHLKSPMHKAIRYGQGNMNALVLFAIAH
ncbi:hypothetical protein [Proteus mirabilis]|uniref:hypothetical protein n=1 Tax=Proteus mirabilis TaxID=584 RepID=UPI003F68435A